MSFQAILLEKDDNKNFSAHIKQIPKEKLLVQEGDTLVKIDYSSLNYKDALALTNKGPVVRQWPMIPGIDGVGVVVKCESAKYKEGDVVILNGWGCGETHWGCLAQYAYVKSDWLVPLPRSLTPWQAMAIGTAGYTAGLCVQRIVEHGIKPSQGKVLVTGATGGVGSVAITLLAKLGYQVAAYTSKLNDVAYLTQLGVSEFLDKDELGQAGKPLQKERWAAVVDVLGSHALANACAQTQYGGIVVACGLAQGMDFPSTVAPFILRGVTLAGIDSVIAPYQKRMAAWQYFAEYLDERALTGIAKTISLSESLSVANEMVAGNIKGRFVIDMKLK